MNQSKLTSLKGWFYGFVETYYDIPEPGLFNIRLKEEHTLKVCAIMNEITKAENLDEQESLTASSIALLHDVGRFPQYRRWGTFRDSESANHARLAIEVIRENRLLDDISAAERLLIEEAVRFHNLLHLPTRYKSPTDKFIKLIRDADKLDIWRVFTNYFQMPEAERPSAVTLGFPDLPEVSQRCLDQINEGRVVELATVKTVNDFVLLLLSWVYDLNFKASYHFLTENACYATIAKKLPAEPRVQETLTLISKTLELKQGHINA